MPLNQASDTGGSPAFEQPKDVHVALDDSIHADSFSPPGIQGACIDTDVTGFASCCDDGPARCVPGESVAPRLREFLAACGEGAYCVPEIIYPLTGAYTPQECSSIGGVVGACMSACVPDVQGFLAFLKQDICTSGELCVPCINPLNQSDTGVCQTLTCDWNYVPETQPEPEPEKPLFDCDNPPPIALIDPSTFPECCPGAHCVPNSIVPESLLSDLDACEEGVSSCVPDDFIKFNGVFTAPSCTAPGGLEGRCLSVCLPAIADNIAKVAQADCADDFRCSPCCDPITGEETGACNVGCDTGSASGTCEAAYESCCKDTGHCIPEELVPEENLENLRKKTCSKDYLCVPDALQEPNPSYQSCSGSILLQQNSFYTGVCMSKCIKIPLDILIGSGTCGKDDDCVPCTHPLNGSPTGAPGCP